ncbi:MAG TPA: bifunctional phosphoribosylaminoimidazolecarboxamide formyltransferase/IMP cyclohydrolase [Candidatus Limnocylindrales bacterium]|nr:bifunctional phosphoribosylaminoimidazolecarboxamide formyltransferase/IMP cyclohydrolase [Candidatus Limnocylindrales bacterium]
MTGRIAVGVSGAGSNLRAVAAAAARGELGGSIVLVFADRPCPAIDWAAEQGFETAILPAPILSDDAGRQAWDQALAQTLIAVRPDVVVLGGFMRVLGPATLAAFPNRVVNTHPALAPAFPGAHPVADALAHGAQLTGVTVHLVDATLDGGPIILQEGVTVLPGDDVEALHGRIQAVEHRLLPRAVALLLAGAVAVRDGRVTVDVERAEAAVPVPRRALLSVSDKRDLESFGRGLVGLEFELVSTGGTASALRAAGLPVTDVAALTGFPEMLDGRVKTLHPRVHGGILADRRRVDHRRQLAAAGIAPFELVVVNLYPFAAAAERPGISFNELVEEIDIGGPSLVRAAAKNHASVAVVTAPERYPAILAALAQSGGVPPGLRAALAVEAFRHTAAYDARIAATLPGRMAEAGMELPDEPGLPGASDPYPASLTIGLDKVETLRYGENPHQAAARYRVPGSGAADGPFASGAPPLQGKALSYNNVLDASAAAALARALDGPGCVIVKHTNPCGAAERPSLLEAWQAALAGDPVSAFGGVVALTGAVDAVLAEALAAIFLEIVVAPAFEPEALAILARRPNLRLVVDPVLGRSRAGGSAEAGSNDPLGSIRTAGGAVLVTSRDDRVDDPAGWTVATTRPPTAAERLDLDLAWRLVRGVTSNAIVLVHERRLVGLGSGQTSRVDAARQAVAKAQAISGADSTLGAACASDAYFPFPDGVEVCLAAGVAAFVQPGGSVRDADAIGVADAAGATMVLTGVRHFRH